MYALSTPGNQDLPAMKIIRNFTSIKFKDNCILTTYSIHCIDYVVTCLANYNLSANLMWTKLSKLCVVGLFVFDKTTRNK